METPAPILEHFCDGLKIVPSKTNLEQLSVLLEAFKIFADRNEKYDDLWMVDGALGNLGMVRHKANRVDRCIDNKNIELVDDALDAINYLAFTIRMAKVGQWDSQKW